jgi:hypothetical protein
MTHNKVVWSSTGRQQEETGGFSSVKLHKMKIKTEEENPLSTKL